MSILDNNAYNTNSANSLDTIHVVEENIFLLKYDTNSNSNTNSTNNASTLCKSDNNKESDILLEYYKDENLMLTKRVEELELKLKKYTNGENHKRYYAKNKDKIKETGASYLQKLKKENPEKIKEYSRTAYLNKKNKKLTLIDTTK